MKSESALFGLTHAQAEASRRLNGSNHLSRKKRRGFLRQLLAAFGDPIIKILCAALAVNLLFALRGEGWFETAGIALSIFLSSLVSTISEYGSESAFLRLQEEAQKTTAKLRRAGKVCVLPCGDIVCGDIVLLEPGDIVPADGLMEQGVISVDQSSINGESREFEKNAAADAPERPDTLSPRALFRCTTVLSGEGAMLVTAVGDSTIFGQMAASLSETPRESPLRTRLSGLAKTLSKLGYLAAALVAFSDLFCMIILKNGMDLSAIRAELLSLPNLMEKLLHALTLAISIVIMAVPEGLPMMITLILSKNMFKMLKDKVMVRKLAGIETAGSMDLLFCDKTGTLTSGKPAVSHFICANGSFEEAALPAHTKRMLAQSGLCNTSSHEVRGKAAGGNATDRLFLELALRLGGTAAARDRFLPFDSERKYSAAQTGNTVYIKGSPEKLLSACTHIRGQDGRILPLAGSDALMSAAEAEGSRGSRLLCFCTAAEFPEGGSLHGLCFECLAVIRDPLRREAKAAVSDLRRAGVQVVMVTGDSRATAESIARECGILYGDDRIVLTGSQLASLSDRRIAALLPSLSVVARALPGDKSRLVRIAQSSERICGMTGDGINDAPALRLADVGFAMGSGTDVAKEAGDIVITDDNISSICRAVLYGRTILKSIQRFLVFQLTMNMCAVGISLIGPFIGIETPITVAQILWINLIMDTLAGLAFAGEPPLSEYMLTPPKKRTSPLLNARMKLQIAGMSAYTLILCIIFLRMPAIRAFFPSEGEYYTGFFALFIFCGIAGAFCARTEKQNPLSSISKNPSFIAIMTCVCAVQLLLIYFGGEMFRASGLAPVQLLFTFCAALTLIPAEDMRKRLFSAQKSGRIVAKGRVGYEILHR